MAVITLTTDFGVGGRYVAQMKGVLYSRAPGATVVDLSHDIPPQDVASAARLLEESASYWPQGSVHLAVVDPGVGTDRPIVAIEALGQRFVGPDNGLFGWLEGRVDNVVSLAAESIETAGDSSTFHGRDLMAPAAAKLAAGAPLSELGPAHAGLAILPEREPPRLAANQIAGCVAEVDHYGNLITNIAEESLGEAPRDDKLRVTLDEHETYGLWRTYGDNPPQSLVALVGSTGRVELAIVNGSAAEMLSAGVGDLVTLDWEPRIDANTRE